MPITPDKPASGSGRRIELAVVAVVAVLAFGWHVGDSRFPSPLQPELAQRVADQANAVPEAAWISAVSGTPFAPAFQPHAWLGRAVMAVGPVERAPLRLRLASAVLVGAVVALLAAIVLGAGCSLLPGAAAPLLLALWGAFRAPDAAALAVALDAALFASSLFGLLRWKRSGRRGWCVASITALALAVADNAGWLLTAIPVAAYLSSASEVERRPGVARRRPMAALLVAAGVVPALVLALVAAAQQLQVVPGAPGEFAASPGPSDIARLALLGPLAIMPPPIRHDRSTLAALASVAGWWGVIGVLGGVLCVAGAFVLIARRRKEALLFVGVPLAVVLAAAFRVPSEVAALALPALLGMTACVAVGADELFFSEGLGRRATGIVVIVMAVVTGAIRYQSPEQRAEVAREEFDRSLIQAASDQPSVIVAETPATDRVFLFAMAGAPGARTGAPLRIPASPAVARAYRGAGFEVLAFDHGRRQLEKQGVLCEVLGVRIPSLRAYLEAMPADSFVAVAANQDASGAWAQQLPEVVRLLGGDPPAGWPVGGAAAVLGVLGPRRRALAAVSGVEASVGGRSGEYLPGTSAQFPGTVTVSARPGGVSIAVDQWWQLESPAGMAVAAFDPAGFLVDKQVIGRSGQDSLISHTQRTTLFRVR